MSLDNVIDIRKGTPFQSMTNELTDMLVELCRKHGYDPGIPRDELKQRVAWQLIEFFGTEG